MSNENVLLMAPAPTTEKDLGVIGSAETVIMAETIGADTTVIGGADGPTAILTSQVGVAENMASAVEILGQGMASIFVVLGLIAVVVAALKKLDNKKK